MIDKAITVIYFFWTFFTLGFSFLHLFRIEPPGDIFERNVMRLGIGLTIFPLVMLILHTIGIPLHWLVILAVSSAVFIAHQVNFWLIKGNLKKSKAKKLDFSGFFSGFKLKKIHIYHALACIFALIILLVYLKGAFGYPYLEDDDPWLHASGAKYVSEFKTYWVDTELKEHIGGVSSYLWPYPPFYTSMMGILHQLNASVNWTLKFFNVLLISLGILFFYIMFARITGSNRHAMVAAGVLAVLPSFMSHFIWAQTLAIVCFGPAMVALYMVYGDKGKFSWRWFLIAILALGSLLMIQPWAAGIFGFFLGMYWIARVIAERSLWKSKYVLLAIFLGCVVSLLFWIPSVFVGVDGQKYDLLGGRLQTEFHRDDSGMGLVYGLKDFLFAPKQSKMDQATGLGIVVCIMVVFSLLVMFANLKKLSRSPWFWVAILWFLFGAYNFYALRTDWFRLTPHRMWAFFSIPVAMIFAKGYIVIQQALRKQKPIAFIVGLIIIVGLLWSAGIPKYAVQTSFWPPGMLFRVQGEIQGYASLGSLEPGTKVLPLCDAEKDRAVIGMDMMSERWDYELYDFRQDILDKTPDEILAFSRSKGYEYMVVDSSCVIDGDFNRTNDFLNSLTEKAPVVSSTQGFVLLRV